MRRESVGIVPKSDGLTIDDLSLIDNDYGDDYKPIVNQQKKMATPSGFIDINDVNDMLITPVPKNTTSYEYISKGTSTIGSYLYSRSAPITSVMSGLSSILKSTIG
jgi:hypothetical protein